jgi:hypothetical protein
VKELRSVLDAEIGEPPRSTVDVDAIVAGQRRRTALRVAGGGATAGVLAVAVALAGAGVLPRPGGVAASGVAPGGGVPGRGLPVGTPSPVCAATPPAPTPAPSSWISPGATPTGDPAPTDPPLPIGAEGRLTQALTAAVGREIGTDRLAPEPVDGESHPPLAFFDGPCDPHDNSFYLAIASIRSAAGTPLGRLLVFVQTSEDTGCTPDGGGGGCTTTRGPHGETVMSRTITGDIQGELKTETLVAVFKPDGTVLQLFAEGPAGTRRPAPLDVPALTRIGLSPGLSVG